MKFLFTLITIFIICNNQKSSAQILFSNYATINSIGINFEMQVQDVENDLQSTLFYKKQSSSIWTKGFELVQSNSFNKKIITGSVLKCDEESIYDIKIILQDATTSTLNGTYFDTITTKKIINPTTFTNIFYVSTTGTGVSNNMASPGDLISTLNVFQSGTKIILLGGTYNVGNLDITLQTLNNSPAVIEGMVGQTIIFDGSDASLNWTYDAASLGYKSTCANQDCNVVIADSVRLYPHKSLKELKYNKIAWESNCRDADVDGFFRSGNNNTIRVKFRDNSDPASKNMKVGRYNYCFKLNGAKNIFLKNIQFNYYGSNNLSAILLINSQNIQIQNCKFGYNDIGIQFQQSSENTIIDNCEFYDAYGNWNFWRMKATYTGVYLPICSGNDVIADNLPGSTVVNAESNRALEKGGIFLSGNFSGKGIVIQNSNFHDMVQGLMLTPQSWWVDNGKNLEIDFFNNEIYNCSEDAMEVDVSPRNVRIWQNNIHHTNMAISVAPANDGPVYLFNNTVRDLTTDTTWIASFGNYEEGRSLKTSVGGTDTTGFIYFINNTVFAQGNNYAMDLFNSGVQTWKKFTFINNIWQSNTQPCFKRRTSNYGPTVSKNNCLFNTGAVLVNVNDLQLYNTLSDYQAAYSIEQNSVNSNPLFINASTNNFGLQNTSSLIDAGSFVDGLHSNGICPDIGAIESFENCVTNLNVINESLKSIVIYPNPISSNKILHLFSSNILFENKIEIYDITGKKMYTYHIKEPKNYFVIPLHSLTSGIYFLKLINNKTSDIKFIIE